MKMHAATNTAANIIAEAALTVAPVGRAVGIAGKALGQVTKVGNVFKRSTTLYRAVSKAELDDIAKYGVRNKAGAYETSKLFAPSAKEASTFGRNNFAFDGIPNHIIKVKVPNSVMNQSTRFMADGMNAVAIPAENLSRLRVSVLNFSPL